MRKREEIERTGGEGMELILETLLDIRELLMESSYYKGKDRKIELDEDT